MRKLRFLAMVPATVLGVGVLVTPTIAQQTGSTTYPVASHPLAAELKGKLDTKSAKVGDTITAKTLSPLALKNGATVPKGSILTGKVSEVQSKSTGNGTASITVVFDQIQPGKKAAPIAIHGVLVGVAPKPNLSDAPGGTSSLPTTMGSTQTSPTLEAQLGYSNDATGGMQGVPMGSSVRDVALSSPTDKTTPDTLTSSKKDFKLESGMRISVELESN